MRLRARCLPPESKEKLPVQQSDQGVRIHKKVASLQATAWSTLGLSGFLFELLHRSAIEQEV